MGGAHRGKGKAREKGRPVKWGLVSFTVFQPPPPHTHTHTHTYICIHMRTCTHTFTHVYTCMHAHAQTGKVYTCGSSSYGQLGHGSTSNYDVPTLVQALSEKEVCRCHVEGTYVRHVTLL